MIARMDCLCSSHRLPCAADRRGTRIAGSKKIATTKTTA